MNRVVLRNGTSTEWITYDPILYEGEIGIETDTNKFKIGNGSDLWTELPYIGVSKTGDSMSGILNMLQNKIINVASPIDSKDVANKEYVDNKVKTDVPLNAKFTDTIVDISGKLNKSNDTLETYTEKTQATTGVINLSLANVFTDTPSASRTYSITNAKSGVAHSFTLIITMGEAVQTLTFPESVIWQDGEIPDMTTANKTYVLTFVSVDGGTAWLGMSGGGFLRDGAEPEPETE